MNYNEFLKRSKIGVEFKNASLKTANLLPMGILEIGRNWLNTPKKPSLILQGETGCGKSYMAAALTHDLWTQGTRWIQYKNSGALDRELRDAILGKSEKSETEILDALSSADILVVDDLGVETISERVQRQYYEIINNRYNNHLPIIITTNCTLGKITEILGERIASRLQMAFHIKFPDRDLRLDIEPPKILKKY